MAGTFPRRIGIIGGTGLDNPDILLNRTEIQFDKSRVKPTAEGKPADYGEPSDILVTGWLWGCSMCLV